MIRTIKKAGAMFDCLSPRKTKIFYLSSSLLSLAIPGDDDPGVSNHHGKDNRRMERNSIRSPHV